MNPLNSEFKKLTLKNLRQKLLFGEYFQIWGCTTKYNLQLLIQRLFSWASSGLGLVEF